MEIFGLPWNVFLTGCEKYNLRPKGAFWGKVIAFEKFIFFILFATRDKNFLLFVDKLLARLSKFLSTCPTNYFEVKHLFWEKVRFFLSFWDIGQNVFGFLSKCFRPCFQIIIHSVEYLLETFVSWKDFNFLIILGHWAKHTPFFVKSFSTCVSELQSGCPWKNWRGSFFPKNIQFSIILGAWTKNFGLSVGRIFYGVINTALYLSMGMGNTHFPKVIDFSTLLGQWAKFWAFVGAIKTVHYMSMGTFSG